MYSIISKNQAQKRPRELALESIDHLIVNNVLVNHSEEILHPIFKIQLPFQLLMLRLKNRRLNKITIFLYQLSNSQKLLLTKPQPIVKLNDLIRSNQEESKRSLLANSFVCNKSNSLRSRNNRMVK